MGRGGPWLLGVSVAGVLASKGDQTRRAALCYQRPMTEKEVIAWLSQPPSPIRRDGALSRDEVAEAVTAYLNNGLDLFEEALLLHSNHKVPRAVALVVLGLEEIAKVPRLVDTFLRFEHGVDKRAWDAFWKSGGSHKAKQALILAYGQTIREQFEADPMFSQRLYRYYASESVLGALDALKQSSFYVDMRQDGLHVPSGDEDRTGAFDYLLTFGQERADSFGAWHVTERRSADYLDVALNRRSFAQWTTNYGVLEVRADILYQAVSLSASYVPDYGAFYAFVDEYRAKTAKKNLREALHSLADVLKTRMERSGSLPFYFDRNAGAYKLMLGLSEKTKIVGAGFGKELREKLLSSDP